MIDELMGRMEDLVGALDHVDSWGASRKCQKEGCAGSGTATRVYPSFGEVMLCQAHVLAANLSEVLADAEAKRQERLRDLQLIQCCLAGGVEHDHAAEAISGLGRAEAWQRRAFIDWLHTEDAKEGSE